MAAAEQKPTLTKAEAAPAPAAKAAPSHLVRMAKTYPETGAVEFLDVHPSTVEEHKAVGFLVVKK